MKLSSRTRPPLGSDTLSYLGIVVPAYLAVEGALDWAWKRKNRKPSEPDRPADEEVL